MVQGRLASAADVLRRICHFPCIEIQQLQYWNLGRDSNINQFRYRSIRNRFIDRSIRNRFIDWPTTRNPLKCTVHMKSAAVNISSQQLVSIERQDQHGTAICLTYFAYTQFVRYLVHLDTLLVILTVPAYLTGRPSGWSANCPLGCSTDCSTGRSAVCFTNCSVDRSIGCCVDRSTGCSVLFVHTQHTLPIVVQEQTQKLKDEYLGLGGSPNNPIPNYFLYVIVGARLIQICFIYALIT